MKVEPVVLEGRVVRLEPLSLGHLPGLVAVGLDEDLWRVAIEGVRSEAEMRGYVETALEEQRAGKSLPFVIVHKETGRIAGSTRFGNIDRANLRVEIGWTWVGVPWQRTGVNSETKLLLLRHAFGTLGCNRVEFKTDSLNERSRAALLGIGAVEEGTLRNHMVTESGRVRHSVYYSVIREEWPEVRDRLTRRLSARERRS